jgi:hypothetical protein
LRQRDFSLIQIVEKAGRIDQQERGSTTVFWEKIREEMNQKFPQKPFNSWRAVQIAHKRLEKKALLETIFVCFVFAQHWQPRFFRQQWLDHSSPRSQKNK